MRLTTAQRLEIRRILGMNGRQDFPRCPGKNRSFVKRCEAAGDYSHSDLRHKCDQCQCKLVAGQGTKGDFYGMGEDTGHFGVGFCYKCERPTGRRSGVAARFARNHMRALQRDGKDPSSAAEFIELTKRDALIASEEIELKRSLDLMRRTIEEFKDKCVDGNVTDYVNGQLAPASDVVRMRLAAELARATSYVSTESLRADMKQYVHINELKIRIPMIISLAERFIHDQDEFVKYIAELKRIFGSINTADVK